MESSAALPRPPRRLPLAPVAGLLAFAVLAAVALSWAKWTPYAHKLIHLVGHPAWTGKDLLAKAGPAGAAPSLAGAWAFTQAYAVSVWKAVIAALLIAAAVSALVPRAWLLGVLRRRTPARSSLAGGLLALPSLMCTCCTAPVAVALRREGAPTSAVLSYWTGNPVLNPAVLAFLALVAPWQWTATRVVVGAVLVFLVAPWVARLTSAGPVAPAPPAPPAPYDLAAAPRRFSLSLLRLSLTLLPEYAVVVFLLGLFRGWLLPLDASLAHAALLPVLVAVLLGTLMVIPTAGEIPILLGLGAVGAGAGTIGALLITLPAISLVSMAMVARTLTLRTTVAMAGGVAGCGLLGGLVLWLLTS